MCEGLAAAIDEYSIPLDGDALAQAFALADRLRAKLVEAVSGFDQAELWQLEGATSMTAWLRDRGGLTGRRARHTTAIARRLRCLPVTAGAWPTGELCGGQVEAIVAAVDTATVDLFAAHEAELVPTLAGLSTIDTVRAMAVWKAHATAEGAEPVAAERAVHLSRTLDGTGALDGTLSPEGYSVVKTALRLAQSPDVEGDPARTPVQRCHDALVDLCRRFLDHQPTQRGGRHRPHLNVIVDLDGLDAGRGGQVVDGLPLDGVTISRLLCDSALHWPPEWCEAHHVTWITDGGETRLDNEVLVCTRHHHVAHQPGWHLQLTTDGTLNVTDPNGRTRSTRPPGALWRAVA